MHIEHLGRQPIIGYRDAVRRKCPLAISSALHGPQDPFEIPPYLPSVRSVRFGEPHSLQNSQAGQDIVRMHSGRFGLFRFCRILDNREIRRGPLLRTLVHVTHNRAV